MIRDGYSRARVEGVAAALGWEPGEEERRPVGEASKERRASRSTVDDLMMGSRASRRAWKAKKTFPD
jgi:hypothetical protein